MRSLIITVGLLLCVGSGKLLASPITYSFTVDTASISGTNGSLDFQFNPGFLPSQVANVQIINFTSDGTLAGACPCGTGDVTDQLPATLTFDNGTGYNDYFDDFTFGSTLSFNVSLYGPALSSPNGTSASGSTFAFSIFSDQAGTIPVLTSNTAEGFADTIDVNLDGTTTLTNYSPETTVSTSTSVSPVPEPPSLLLLLSGFLGCICIGRSRKRVA
jgi:hypothetical protein